jgi:hypothetical protein
MKRLSAVCLTVAAIAAVMIGCIRSESTSEADSKGSIGWLGAPHVTVPSGTELTVRLGQTLSSETVRSGDRWQGVVTHSLIVDGREVIPSGAEVEGVVVTAEEAKRGSRARLELAVRTVRIGDRKTSLHASAEPVVARSTRTRNLGAIAGGAVAGALIGKATGDNAGKGAILGGAVATGAVAVSKGYQVVLERGSVMTFSMDQSVSVRV